MVSIYRSLLQKEILLPPVKWHKVIMAFAVVVLPNVIFWLISVFNGAARPLLNLDYALVALLFVLSWKPLHLFGALAFWLALLFDVLMLVMQQFPFMDLIGALYLAPFILNAPFVYQMLAIVLLIYLIAMPMLLQKLAVKTDLFHMMLFVIPLGVIAYFTGHLQYYERSVQANMFGANNFYYAKSQYLLYQSSQENGFLDAARTEPIFLKLLSQEQAISRFQQPRAKKILLIMNESWGQPQNQALQDSVLEKVAALKSRFDYYQTGHFQFIGATVEAELRELCGYRGARGYSFRRSPAEKFAQCLPNELTKEGYQAFALHGASGQLYDRFSWYPKAGFQHVKTGEHLIGKQTCEAFNGVCDSVLYNEVADAFGVNDKIFYYWLTLTTHSDYPEKDLFNHRLQCEQYGLSKDTDLCRNFRLQAQFFDGLAELLQRPEMKGVEVLVVGDHSPPTIKIGETLKYMQQGDVAWLHLKVKD